MSESFQFREGDKDRVFTLASMCKYLEEKQELDKLLEKTIEPVISGKALRIVDACCGVGHVCLLLNALSPQSSFHGVDQLGYLIDRARTLAAGYSNISFEQGDLYEFARRNRKAFDVAISWKTISWLPYYPEMLEAVMSCAKSHVFLSSLFYEGDIDFEIKVREYQKEQGKSGFNSYYNVYSLPRFTDHAYSLGARDVHVVPFEIKIDIPPPPIDQMGTYTLPLADGKRLQVSGVVVMNWKIIRIDL